MSTRNSLRVDRRRRVFADESRLDQDAPMPRIFRVDSDAPSCRYNYAALQSLNAPIAKYVPLRRYSLVVCFLSGLIPLFSLLAADAQLETLQATIGGEGIRAFDISASGSLVDWVSSVTFFVAAMLMLGIYSVRRHRRDDYRGRYTVWGWAIVAAVFISVDATAGLHDAWQGLCEYATQTSVGGDGKIWWVGSWAIVFGGMMVRLMFEMSSSRRAIIWSCAALICYLWSGAIELGSVPFGSERSAGKAQVAGLLLGHHLVLFSLVVYARQVVLEALGKVEPPAKRENAAASDKSLTGGAPKKSSKSEEVSHIKPDHSEQDPGPVLRTVSPDRDSSAEEKSLDEMRPSTPPKLKAIHASQEENEDSSMDSPKLSKAERRRLRKEQKRRKAA